MAPPPLAESSDLLTAVLVVGPLVLVAFAYGRRAHRLGTTGHPVAGWRQACFYAGALVIAAAVTGLGPLSQELLYVHMIEHLLLGEIGALLVVLGLTGPLIAPILTFRVFGVRIFDRLRVLANPLIAFPLWALDLYIWHLPVFYQAALRHPTIHVLEHAMFLGL